MSKAFTACVPHRVLWLAVTDAVVIAATVTASLLVASHTPSAPWLSQASWNVLIVSAVLLLCLHYYDLYEFRITRSFLQVATRLSQVLGTACVVLALLYYLVPQLQLQRGDLIAGTLLIGTALVANRRLFWAFNRSPRLCERAVMLGQGHLAAMLTAELDRRPELGLRVAGALPMLPGSQLSERDRELFHNELVKLVETEHASRVIVALDQRSASVPLTTLVELRSRGIRVEDGAEALEVATAKVPLESLDLPNLLALDRVESRAAVLSGRAMGLLVSSFALMALAPLFALVAIAIKLDSRGPVIFRQQRIGRGGRPFLLYKFRSMVRDADADGIARPAEIGDRRITRVGRWLRRCRLDELPQLLNIARGDLNFVGPRPFVPEQESALVSAIPYYSYRWTVKPGVTGWAQIHQGYCANLADNTEKLAYDLFYIKHRSLGLDAFVLFQTVKILILGRGAR